MQFWCERARGRLVCAKQSAHSHDLAIAYIAEAAAAIDNAMYHDERKEDLRAMVQEMVMVSRHLMHAWSPREGWTPDIIDAHAAHDFNDES
jgi:hypothetical protein